MKNIKVVLLALGLVSFNAQADRESIAQVANGQLRAYVKVARTCYVQDAELNFGTIDGLFAAEKEGSTDIIVRCTADAGFKITLDEGKNFAEDVRHMTDEEGNLIAYHLYQPDHETPWDKNNPLTATATGNEQPFTVYGLIPSDQKPVPGDRNYNDYISIDLYM